MCHLFSVIGRLPKAKKPKAEFDACLDALMTVFTGYVVAAACQELGIDDPDSKITQLKGMSMDERLSFIIDVVNVVVDKCGIMTDALLNKKIVNTKDGVYNYSHVLCHYAALCLEFTDAWGGERITLSWWVYIPSAFSCQWHVRPWVRPWVQETCVPGIGKRLMSVMH